MFDLKTACLKMQSVLVHKGLNGQECRKKYQGKKNLCVKLGMFYSDQRLGF